MTRSLSCTSSVLPARQRVSFRMPPLASFSASWIARAMLLRASSVNELAAGAEDDVVHLHHAIRRRVGPDMGDQDLPAGRRGPPLHAIEEVAGFV